MNPRTGPNGLQLPPTDVTLGGSVNDWNPAGLAAATVLRVTATASAPNVSGLAGGVAGRLLLVVCAAGTFTVTNQDAASAAQHRLILESSSLTLSAEGSPGLLLYYDSSRWRQIAFDN